MNEDGYRKLSWNFTDKNMVPQHVMAVLESKKKEMSLFVVEGGPEGSLIVEPHKARWIEGISLVSFDLAEMNAKFISASRASIFSSTFIYVDFAQ